MTTTDLENPAAVAARVANLRAHGDELERLLENNDPQALHTYRPMSLSARQAAIKADLQICRDYVEHHTER